MRRAISCASTSPSGCAGAPDARSGASRSATRPARRSTSRSRGRPCPPPAESPAGAGPSVWPGEPDRLNGQLGWSKNPQFPAISDYWGASLRCLPGSTRTAPSRRPMIELKASQEGASPASSRAVGLRAPALRRRGVAYCGAGRGSGLPTSRLRYSRTRAGWNPSRGRSPPPSGTAPR